MMAGRRESAFSRGGGVAYFANLDEALGATEDLLLEENARIQTLVNATAAERWEGRHASEVVKQAHIEKGEALRSQLLRKVCRLKE